MGSRQFLKAGTTGLITGVGDIQATELKHHVVALAKTAQVQGVPVIVTATMPDGTWGPPYPN
jgi:hypothetical protein